MSDENTSAYFECKRPLVEIDNRGQRLHGCMSAKSGGSGQAIGGGPICTSATEADQRGRRTKANARCEQITSLRGEENWVEVRFLSVAMQVAAHEARQAHGKLAQQLRQLVDEARDRHAQRSRRPVPLAQLKGELAALVLATYSATRLSSMVLPEDLEDRLKRVIAEQRQQHKILERGLTPRRKLLLLGPPGTGSA